MSISVRKKLSKTLSPYKRVLYKAETPGFEEFKTIALITLGGVALIGLIGFVIYWLMVLVI